MSNVTESLQNGSCRNSLIVEGSASPVVSALMFALGVLGNLTALLLLEVRRRKERSRKQHEQHQRRSLFHVLVTALVLTDLAGTCMISPLVQAAHALDTTLFGMSNAACQYFGFAMTFFSLVTLSLLLAMALERYLSIGFPYLYGRHVSLRCGYVTIPCIYALCALFCFMPFFDIGSYVQYCPGTWCFIDMNPSKSKHRVFANVYATVILLMVVSVVACNCFVAYHLVLMYRRRTVNCGAVVMRNRKDRRHFSLSEEMEYLILLIFMTAIFVICSLPLMILGPKTSNEQAGGISAKENLKTLNISRKKHGKKPDSAGTHPLWVAWSIFGGIRLHKQILYG
ncbi:prostaglandin E receptor 2a (subtype EP2) isoform X2 [Trichomycterus rosablanca]|uniref:prostaglandin E receptor 2a (subtype EP2) isoform X2 n=1 Tax=Trichomycterus rosablanca TaxID=2290929 RepID=UPI002F358759